jgi:quinol monooxygenase YgiN
LWQKTLRWKWGDFGVQDRVEARDRDFNRVEPGVLTLYAVSVKDHPNQVRLFETYSNQAAYQSHLQTAHFRKYKVQTPSMVKSLTLIETDPILLGSKSQ